MNTADLDIMISTMGDVRENAETLTVTHWKPLPNPPQQNQSVDKYISQEDKKSAIKSILQPLADKLYNKEIDSFDADIITDRILKELPNK